MIIGISGYGYTGSGAVVDLLKEFPCCAFPAIDFEFNLSYRPHGLEDLELHLVNHPVRFFSSDVAIKEFKRLIKRVDAPRSGFRRLSGSVFRRLSMEYIDSLIAVKWRGCSREDSIYGPIRFTLRFRLMGRIITAYERITGKRYPLPKSDEMYLSVQPEDFLEKTKEYVQSVIKCLGLGDSERIVLDQPFNANDPRRSMRYFDDPRAIMIDRDPRDLYVLVKRYLGCEASFIPSENVEDFITYFKLIRKANNEEDDKYILRLQYEDLIYKYEETTGRIIHFLELTGEQWHQKELFDPAVSIHNTQLYLRHPDLAMDIQKIEHTLSAYLYPFNEMNQKIVGTGKPF